MIAQGGKFFDEMFPVAQSLNVDQHYINPT
jgi:hypothetical protein